jgi:hypothetical protein
MNNSKDQAAASLKAINAATEFGRGKCMGLIGIAVLILTCAAPLLAEQPLVIPVGSDAYTMWDLWPYQRIGVRAYMRSTYDRTGGNEWADASHFLYQLADDYNVTLDVQGPGVLYFVRTNHWHGSPWHYNVDGIDHIVQESSTADPLHPIANSVFLPESAFPSPLALTWSQTKGADLSWVPIGFGKSFQIAYGRTFYGTGYYIYHQFVGDTPLSQPISAWDGKTAPDPRVLELISRAGSDIAPQPGVGGVLEASGQLDVLPDADVPVWESSSGSSMVRALEFSVPEAEAVAFSRVQLRVTWDNRKTPSIDAPISLFYGAGLLYNRQHHEYLVKSLPMVIHYDQGRVYLSCYFPMPFFQSARVELRGLGGTKISDVGWKVRYEPYLGPTNQVGYFHATYRDHPTPELGKDLVLLDTRQTEGGGDWSGSFVGTSFIFSHDAQLSTLEGDPRFFFDDSKTPQAQGTGTEEWGGGGDYWGGENMTLALAGHPVGAKSPSEAISPEDQIESAYRFLLADLMPFGKNAVIRLEHGGEDDSTEHYETVTYWYGLPAASLIKTDDLAVGDEHSEAQHHYISPEASKPYALTSRYEWGPDHLRGIEIYPATTDRGRTTKTESAFTLKIDPRNVGVMLRRKLDYSYANQRAEIYVADARSRSAQWKLAGIWYTAGSNTSVGSNGGTGNNSRLLGELNRSDSLRARAENKGDSSDSADFLQYADTLRATMSQTKVSPTMEELGRLRERTRGFISGVNSDRQRLASQEVIDYANALESALDADLEAGPKPEFSSGSHELGPTEHIVITSNRRFRDDEFLIPRSLTQGRSAIRIRVKFMPVSIALFPGHPFTDSSWSEMRYAAYSFVVPEFGAQQHSR